MTKSLEPNEMRVNNFVVDKDGNIDQIIVGWQVDEGTEYYGIELTEELLLQCGFLKEERGFSIQVGNNLDLCIDLNAKLTGYGLNWKDSSVEQWKNIEYVHELQNIYYCLTGEELKIEL